MKRSSATAAVQVSAPAAGAPMLKPTPEALLKFQLRTYQPRAAANEPPTADRAPSSIKDAIVRWLDEQL